MFVERLVFDSETDQGEVCDSSGLVVFLMPPSIPLPPTSLFFSSSPPISSLSLLLTTPSSSIFEQKFASRHLASQPLTRATSFLLCLKTTLLFVLPSTSSPCCGTTCIPTILTRTRLSLCNLRASLEVCTLLPILAVVSSSPNPSPPSFLTWTRCLTDLPPRPPRGRFTSQASKAALESLNIEPKI